MVARLRPTSIIEIPRRGKRKSYYMFDCVIDRLIKQGFLNKGRKDGDLGKGKFVCSLEDFNWIRNLSKVILGFREIFEI